MTEGLKPVGVELVAAGGNQFTTTLNKATNSLNVYEKACKLASNATNALGEIATGALRRIGELGVDALVRAGRELLQFGTRTLQAAAQGSHLNTTLETLGERLLGIIRFNIDPLLNQFDSLITKSAPAIEGWVAFLSKSFATLGQNALTWGENISGQLAQGIYDGAQAVLDALIYIGNLITSWLMPHSPPKLLPDLDDWGTQAANIYLQGWTKADFSIFNTIGSEIEALLRSQAGKNDTGLIPRILGTREAIAEAIKQSNLVGEMTADSLNAIYKAAGAVTPALQDYLKSVFDLEDANFGLTAAQAELNAATEKYQNLLKPLDAQLSAISEAQQQFTEDQEKSRLALILADPNATAGEKEQARLRLQQIDAERNRRSVIADQKVAVDAAQAKVDAAQKEVDAATLVYETNKAAVDLQIEQNRLLQEQLNLLERLAEKAAAGPKGGGGGGVTPVHFEIPPEIQAKIDAFLAKIEELKTAWANAWDAMGQAFKPVTDAWNAYVIPGLTNLQTAFTTSLPAIQESIGQMVQFAVANLNITLPGVFRNVGSSLNSLAAIWTQTNQLILDSVEVTFGYIFTTISVTLLLVSGIVAASLRLIQGTFKTFELALQGDWDGVWENVKITLAEAFVIIHDTLTTALEAILLLAGTDLATFYATWSGIWTNVGIIVSTVVGGVSTAISGLVTNISTWMGQILTYVQPVIDTLLTLLGLQGQTAAGGAAAPGTGLNNNTVLPPATGGTYAPSNVSNTTNVTNNYSPSYVGSPVAPQLDFAAMGVWAQ